MPLKELSGTCMKALRYSVVLLLVFFSQWLSAASVEVALGPVVKQQQSQAGSYWIQLVAVNRTEAVDQVKKANPDLNIAYHTDNKGLKRVLAGPYASYEEAFSVKRKMGKSRAFVRFIKQQPQSPKNQPQKSQPPKPVINASANPVKSYIDQEKQECTEAATQPPSEKNAECVCCLHIRNNTLIRH